MVHVTHLPVPAEHARAATPVVRRAAVAVAEHAQAVLVPFLGQALLPQAVAAVVPVVVVPAVQLDVARQSVRVVVVATAKNFSQ